MAGHPGQWSAARRGEGRERGDRRWRWVAAGRGGGWPAEDGRRKKMIAELLRLLR